MSVFEILMLLSFGAAWPVSIIKSLKTKETKGKSPMFMFIIIGGYICGILHKIFYAFDYVIYLYLLNLLMVSFDLSLYYRFNKEVKV